jgi:hypothetical protein
MMQKQDIRDIFCENIQRVKVLIELSKRLENEKQQRVGRSTSEKKDLLRAEVVLLHAAFETLLREYEYWGFNRIIDRKIDNLRKDKTLSSPFKIDLLHVSDSSIPVGAEISHAREKYSKEYKEYLDTKASYNNIEGIDKFLKLLDIKDIDTYGSIKSKLRPLIARRHRIVHRADHEENRSSIAKPGRRRSNENIGIKMVEDWTRAVEEFEEKIWQSTLRWRIPQLFDKYHEPITYTCD